MSFMTSQKARTQLMIRLEPELGPVSATSLVDDLERVATRSDQLEAVLVLLDELEETSAKAVRAAVEALPELQRRGGLGDVVPWIDLGIAIAASSGATALK